MEAAETAAAADATGTAAARCVAVVAEDAGNSGSNEAMDGTTEMYGVGIADGFALFVESLANEVAAADVADEGVEDRRLLGEAANAQKNEVGTDCCRFGAPTDWFESLAKVLTLSRIV